MKGKENWKEKENEKWMEKSLEKKDQIGGCVFGQKAISKISWDVNSTIPLALDTHVRKEFDKTENIGKGLNHI